MIKQLKNFFKKMHPQRTQSNKIPKFMLDNYFVTKQVFGNTFWKIQRIQIQICPQNSIEPKYGGFYLNIKAGVHGLVLLVQLS